MGLWVLPRKVCVAPRRHMTGVVAFPEVQPSLTPPAPTLLNRKAVEAELAILLDPLRLHDDGCSLEAKFLAQPIDEKPLGRKM